MIEISEDTDLAYALSLQEELDREQESEKSSHDLASSSALSSKLAAAPVSVVDDSWELVDPIPDVRQLFLQFNDAYFKGLLSSVEVRWSPRMTLCAGLCCYEGRGGLCSIRLSEPLLKLRPRRDLVQTLLHEMIHALLFVTQNNKDHDAHGPEFLKHMQRINAESGAKITVYHNFHDEVAWSNMPYKRQSPFLVNVYRQHWWKCDGPCSKRPPYYGMVKRAMNRAPSARDPWWADHQRTCGGIYTKIKEPENYGAKKTKSKEGKGKKDLKTASAKGKGEGSESGVLQKFLKRKKSDTDSGGSDSDKSCENGIKRKKGPSEEGAKASSINGGVVKPNHNQPGTSRWIADVIPFSGPGRTLGSNSTEPKSVSQDSGRSLVEKARETTKSSVVVIKTPSPNKSKKIPSPTLTIVDAFQRAKDKSKNGNSESDSLRSPVLGSQRKPIELDSSPSPNTGTPGSVHCPACQALVLQSKINDHLDFCLN